MKKYFLSLIISFACLSAALAQNETDALRYSQLFPGGTARFIAVGGSFGALGGDFSTLGVNPAGIGIYRGSEFTITPSLNYSQAESSFFNTLEEDMKYNFNLNNLGVVFAFPVGSQVEEGGWQYVNIGLGINRHNNFNDRWIADGFNPYSSKMASILQQANREGHVDNLDPFSTELAWETWLIGEDEDGFFTDMLHGVDQRQETNTSGSIREFVLTMGGNYNDRLYLGATVGFPSVFYEEESIYQERDSQDANPTFNSMTFTNRFKTTGSGYNFKLGAIVRLTDVVRLGGAFHSPTFYELKDRYNATMRSDLELDYDTKSARSPEGRFDYELNTPLRAIGSLGLVFGQAGLISVDYEYTDYTKARLRSSEYLFSDENRAIRESFTAQHTIRIGGEVQLSPVILRAGYGYYGNPYRSEINEAQRSIISVGFGLREQEYFIDFAYTYTFYSEDYHLYLLDSEDPVDYNLTGGQWQPPVVNRDFSASTFRVTVGWRF